MKRIAILGSTGSIGQSALAVVDAHPDRLQRRRACGGRQRRRARRAGCAVPAATCRMVTAVRDAARASASTNAYAAVEGGCGLVAVATHPDVDIVLCASSGTAALEAVLAAIEAGKTHRARQQGSAGDGRRARDRRRAARAASRFCRSTASTTPSTSACTARHRAEITRIILTASGGPFRELAAERARDASTPEDALRHPTWQMGRKITIDSATLMNKGLEVIEAHWLFGVPPDRNRRGRASAVDRALDGRARATDRSSRSSA